MSEITEKAFAKINLNLGIIGKREDGYHLISSVMQTIDLHDEILIRTCECGINIKCSDPRVPVDETNTVYKAAKILAKEHYLQGGLELEIKKNIPVCAGLGGPSSDAAAVIRGINNLAGLKLSAEKMREIAVKIGADVPFLIEGGRALCEGIGEKLTPLESEKLILLLAKPTVQVSSKWAYGEFDSAGGKHIKNSEYYNDFESVVIPEYPIIGELKGEIKAKGAAVSLMSGSGSTVFGIFENNKNRDDCYFELSEKYPEVRFICTQTI